MDGDMSAIREIFERTDGKDVPGDATQPQGDVTYFHKHRHPYVGRHQPGGVANLGGWRFPPKILYPFAPGPGR